jgi:hypothetical protein
LTVRLCPEFTSNFSSGRDPDPAGEFFAHGSQFMDVANDYHSGTLDGTNPGITAAVREWAVPGVTNYESTSYTVGLYTGIAASTLASAGAAGLNAVKVYRAAEATQVAKTVVTTAQVGKAAGNGVGQTASAASNVVSANTAATTVRGGAGVVRIGQAGERAVGNIGPKVRIVVSGRGRIPDGLTRTVLSEVKNVRHLSYTRQLRDFAAHAAANRLRFDLYVRPSTTLSRNLQKAVDAGIINLRYIP